jgi:hypothetical protein
MFSSFNMNPFRASRRRFLKLAGLAAASLAMPRRVRSQDAQPAKGAIPTLLARPFEVEGSTYAWEVHDEGIDVILDNMTSMAGINAVYLIALMHREHRPFTSKQFPHNPLRAEWMAEDSCVYFHPHLDLYGRIKPAVSRQAWLNSTDYLKVVVDAAHARGMKAGAEISHTPIPASVLKENPDFQQRDLDDVPKGRLCSNSPHVREYLVALFGDVARNYNVDFIQTCMWLYSGGSPKGGTCFCQHCQREARASGFDLAAAMPALKADPQAQPQLDQWLAFRRKSVARIYQLIAERIHRERPSVDFRINDTLAFGPGIKADRAVGLYLEDLQGAINSCVLQDHTEQNGNAGETFSQRKSWIADNRSSLAAGVPLISGVAVRPKATPALVRKGIQAAVESGANGIACKHYDGSTYSLLRAVRDGLSAAGVKGFAPILGIEAESMKLSGYVSDTYLDESCIKTTGTGTAVSKFAQASGLYDVIVSYASEKEGQASLSLSVGGSEKAAWRLNEGVGEGVGCWKRRTIPKIKIQSGDEIKITGVAGGAEGARVDFIEFIAGTPRQ